MKIVVRDSRQSTLGSIDINIRDIGSGLEKIAVKSLSAVGQTKAGRAGRSWSSSRWTDRPGRSRASIGPVTRRDIAEVPARRPIRPDYTRPIARSPVRFDPSSRYEAPALQTGARRSSREIRITLPSVKIPPALAQVVRHAGRLFKLLKRQFVRLPGKVRIAGTACAAILLLFGMYSLFGSTDRPEVKAAASKRPALTRGVPDYATALPDGKTIDDLGGWIRVSPPGRNAVYAYADKIGGVRIDVSEQPLPPALRNHTSEQMARLAQSYAAKGTLTAAGTTVYIGTSAKGPQSLIFDLDQKGLLVLIKSVSPLADNQWVTYINSLR